MQVAGNVKGMAREKAEPDVEHDSETTKPDPDDEYVGRIARDDSGDAEESGAERRREAD
jgi:hypothetical protein